MNSFLHSLDVSKTAMDHKYGPHILILRLKQHFALLMTISFYLFPSTESLSSIINTSYGLELNHPEPINLLTHKKFQ